MTPPSRLLPAALLVVLALAACASAADDADPAPTPQAAQAGGVGLRAVGTFDRPLLVTAPPGDRSRLVVVEQGGTVRVVRRGRVLGRPMLDVSREIASVGEQGLLGLAFAPDFAKSRRLYVNLTNRSGDTEIREYRVGRRTPDVVDRRTRRLVLRQDQPEENHNGGHLLFGPDRRLYIGLGDGGGGGDQHGERGNAQNLGTLLGKILRIDPARSGRRPYSVPRDNPFVSRAGARPEIYAYGLRNPWRFAFDRRTGGLSIADVGQGDWEEVTFVDKGQGRGANFGWRPFEGKERFAPGEDAPGHVPPQIVLSHADGNCSVTGGVVVRDRSLPINGRYVFGDFCKGDLLEVTPGGSSPRSLGLSVPNLSSFGEDAAGRVYATSLDGRVSRLVKR